MVACDIPRAQSPARGSVCSMKQWSNAAEKGAHTRWPGAKVAVVGPTRSPQRLAAIQLGGNSLQRSGRCDNGQAGLPSAAVGFVENLLEWAVECRRQTRVGLDQLDEHPAGAARV